MAAQKGRAFFSCRAELSSTDCYVHMTRPNEQQRALILHRVQTLWPEVTALRFSDHGLHVLTDNGAAMEDQHLAVANALHIAEEVLGCALRLHWVPDELWAGSASSATH
jgi:hypothetical protein